VAKFFGLYTIYIGYYTREKLDLSSPARLPWCCSRSCILQYVAVYLCLFVAGSFKNVAFCTVGCDITVKLSKVKVTMPQKHI